MSPVVESEQRRSTLENRHEGLSLTFETVLRELGKRSFAMLSTADERGRPHAVGVEYGIAPDRFELYVMTRRHLKKARNIAVNPNVSMVVPLTRRVLWFLPPPCIQFAGIAQIVDRSDPRGIESFHSFFLGRRILKMYEQFERRGETRVCFLRITPGPVIRTYGVGQTIWQLARRMEAGMGKVNVPAEYRSRA